MITDTIEVMEAGGDAIIVDIIRHDADNPEDEERHAVIEEVIIGDRLIEEKLNRSDMIARHQVHSFRKLLNKDYDIWKYVFEK